jgi:hypothetical protein
MTMSEIISVASGFQYSVNIGYDLNSDEKLENFIPTKSALSLLEEILLSTNPASSDRARVLIGAYGKGKSHIVLMILSMLMKRDLEYFRKAMPKINENTRLLQCVRNYYDSNKRVLPVIITGSNTSLTQAFLLALQRTLSDHGLLDVMPETNYKAAVAVIKRWKSEFPDTYKKLKETIEKPISKFIDDLCNYNISTYEKFERIFPILTAGSVFNPFLGFDVVELYESVAKGLRTKGYTGIYVVYDEFSKFLEANITNASVSDTKMLQDFAEKCTRSGDLQMHLMLISHKEISNYIDKLPQQKVDGWKGVSERFKHIHLNNNFTQTYEIISSVIQKEKTAWDSFGLAHKNDFNNLEQRYKKHPIFSDTTNELNTAIYGCYPLQPVSTFILPRLSERVAQNERTLFTFLSAEGTSTLYAFLDNHDDSQFRLVTPDLIYDYFEPLFKKEAYSSDIHSNYILTRTILTQIPEGSLGSKIVKTISLIYILEQYERLKPTKEEIIGVFSTAYEVGVIERAIDNLIEKDYVIYLKRSNDYLRLKNTSGVDVKQKIHDLIEVQAGNVAVKDTLNASNFDNYMYPSRYNDDREMTRFFSFEFIDGSEISFDIDWKIKSESINADGIIYGIIPQSEDEIKSLANTLKATSQGCERYIFVLPKHYTEIETIVHEYNAVSTLRSMAIDDPVMFDEYEVIFEDLYELIKSFMSSYTHPEECKVTYFHDGDIQDIHRKASLTELMSVICDSIYSKTPVINNESVNRDDVTSVSNNSRSKIIAALLRNGLESNLGLSGTGQEVSIMRSTLIRTGVWSEYGGIPKINLQPEDSNMQNMLSTIESFILQARQNGSVGFSDLYMCLTAPEYHIGLRKGLIPIYLAAVIHEYKQQVIITDRFGQVPANVDVLLQINADPGNFSLTYLDWDPEKEEYIQRLSGIFAEHVIEAEKGVNAYDFVANAMRRWFMSLPKYSKESRYLPDRKKEMHTRRPELAHLLRQNTSSYELLFKKLPEAFGCTTQVNAHFAEDILVAKKCYDESLSKLKGLLIAAVKGEFMYPKYKASAKRMSLTSTISEWCDSLDEKVFEQLFTDGTDKCLRLFKTVTNDEEAFISRLAKLATDLRIEDWDNNTHKRFCEMIKQYKATAEVFHSKKIEETMQNTSNYQISFTDDNGVTTIKRFDKVDITPRGKLLYNQIASALESMGHSIQEQEKRQILMEVLKKLC